MSKAIITEHKAKLMPEFNSARKIVASIKEHGRRMQHDCILLGIELNKTKAALGIKRGGDQKSEKSKPQNAGLIWEDLVLEQTGYSVDQCERWMKIASGAQKHIPLLTAKDILQKPFHTLPEKRQEEVVKVLQKAVDGQTMAEIAVTFGVCKAPKLNHPPKPTKDSAAKRKANAEDETLQAAELMKLTEEHIETLEQITLAAAFKAADTERLAALENAVDALKQAIAEELKTRRKSKP